jgi:hypothetical protein
MNVCFNETPLEYNNMKLIEITYNNLSIKIPDNMKYKQKIIVKSLLKYFSTNGTMERVLPLISKNEHRDNTVPSFRVLDWFITNYSKKYNIIYNVKENGNIRHFVVYLEYKNQLDAFKKEYFDPFNRSTRIFLTYNDIEYELTIGKLNFLKWADMYNITNYVEEHLEEIFNDMNQTNKVRKTSKINGNKIKRSKKDVADANKSFGHRARIVIDI